jgi:hypothetical protein
MASRLSDGLVAAGLVSADNLRAAIARQAVYGGALDTALLELDALDEATLWGALARATGLSMPDPPLYETPMKTDLSAEAAEKLDAAWSDRCRAVPVGVEGEAIQILCGEPVVAGAIAETAAALGRRFELYVVPEVRLAAVRQAVYERPMSSRLVRLFARVAGTQPVRRWYAAHAKPVAKDTAEGVEILQRRAPAASLPVVSPPAAELRPVTATAASVAPGPAPAAPAAKPAPGPRQIEKRDVLKLIARLAGKGDEVATAHAALVAFTKQDLGTKPRRWELWWEKHMEDDRLEWLFEGLSHKTPEIRESAEHELRAITGEYFGYHFDLPRREREEARARWQSWWYETGRAKSGK